MKSILLGMVLWATGCALATTASVRTFYLKPSEDGRAVSGLGSENSPFTTFAAAQQAVRSAVADSRLPAGPIQVVVLDGTYFLKDTIRLSQQDSGTVVHPVVWRSQTKGGARWTGGGTVPALQKLTADDPAWARIPAAAREHVKVADLKAAGITDYGVVAANGVGGPYMELVWDGKFQTLARWPNEAYTGIAKVEKMGKDQNGRQIPATSFVYKDDRPSQWVNEPDPYGNGFFCHNWASARVAFKNIDSATKTIEQKGRGSNYGYSTIGFWFGYNLLCELDAPGEYYIDRQLGRLYFWPTTEGDDARAALTLTRDLFALRDVSYTRFEGFVFENCRAIAFQARGGLSLEVVGSTFRNMGTRALDLNGCSQSRIAGCDIAYCGSGGIYVQGGDVKTLTQAGISVENCHIHHYALLSLTYASAIGFGGCGVFVRHNTIHDGPHTAICFGGREHTIAFNEIHSVCLDAGEMGAVYAGRDWTLCGNRIEANYFHDIYNPRSQRNRAIMLDDGAAGFSVTSNRFERVAEGVSLSAIGNVVENNLFVSNFPPVSAWQKWENHNDYTNPRYTHKQLVDRLAQVPVHEEPWKTKYPYLAMIDDAIKTGKVRDPTTRTVVRANMSVGGATNLVQFMGAKYAYSESTWNVSDNTVDGAKPTGFKPLPSISEIGVYVSPERASWPISHPITLKCTNLTFKH